MVLAQDNHMYSKSHVTANLNVPTVMTTCWQLNATECNWALQGHPDGCLLYPILSIWPYRAWYGAAGKVPFN